MNKKVVLFVLCAIISLIIGLIIYFKFLKISNSYNPVPEVIPSYEFISTDGILVSTDALSADNIIIVFFSKDCMFCEHQGKDFARNSTLFRNSKILFITIESIESAIEYNSAHKLDTIPNYYCLYDDTAMSPNVFGVNSMPTTILYDREGKLIKSFSGEVNANKIYKTIQGNE